VQQPSNDLELLSQTDIGKIMLLLLLWGCPKKNAPESLPQLNNSVETEVPEQAGESPPDIEAPPPFAGKQQTETLLTVGILDPLPEEVQVNSPVIVQFRTLYRNGCWSQTEPSHQINGFDVSHVYTTSVATDRICTMALLPGGFQTELRFPEPGTYQGEILVDEEKKATYSLKVVE
jgi:hypothetical protein